MIQKLLKNKDRNNQIKIVGLIGILTNLVFAGTKLIIGTLANSISIISDAVNNLSDALSSIITLLGLRLANKAPNKKHPLGYGRVEYLSSLIISVLILFAGIQFITSSVGRIMNPEEVAFSNAQFAILTITLIGKLLLGRLNIKVGEMTNSLSLKGSGADSLMDAIASGITIVTALIAMYTGLNIDGYVGVLLALFILYTGITQLSETINSILGERPEKELVAQLREDLSKYPLVIGSYDFIIHNYGPTTHIGTINLEFEDTNSAKDIYDVMYKAQRDLYAKYNIFFTFGLYSVNTSDEATRAMYDNVKQIVLHIPHVVTMHAFYVDFEQHIIRFDIVHDFDMKDVGKTKTIIEEAIKQAYPEFILAIGIDLDYA